MWSEDASACVLFRGAVLKRQDIYISFAVQSTTNRKEGFKFLSHVKTLFGEERGAMPPL